MTISPTGTPSYLILPHYSMPITFVTRGLPMVSDAANNGTLSPMAIRAQRQGQLLMLIARYGRRHFTGRVSSNKVYIWFLIRLQRAAAVTILRQRLYVATYINITAERCADTTHDTYIHNYHQRLWIRSARPFDELMIWLPRITRRGHTANFWQLGILKPRYYY